MNEFGWLFVRMIGTSYVRKKQMTTQSVCIANFVHMILLI